MKIEQNHENLYYNENEIVTALYQSLLQREPDVEGLKWHSQSLRDRTVSLQQKIGEFVRSPEFCAKAALLLRHTLQSLLESHDKEYVCRGIVNYLRSILPDKNTHPVRSKNDFLKQLDPNSRILDVGCGNDSPKITKNILPECYYIGIDVGDYNQSYQSLADEYIIVDLDSFVKAIDAYSSGVDAVISNHNVEHCCDRYGVIASMAKTLKVGGMIYIAYPSPESVEFPSRRRTLNYYDDPSHVGDPPDFGRIISILVANGLRILYASSIYQPPIPWIEGLGNLDASERDGDLKDGTWCYWGFESVICAERVS